MPEYYNVFIPLECIDPAFQVNVFTENSFTFEYVNQLIEFINYREDIDNDKREYPALLGKYSPIGITPSGNIISEQLDLNMYKLHVTLNADLAWLKAKGYKRTSDNYLVYAEHIYESNTVLFLGIISPDAHNLLLPNEHMKNKTSSPLMKKCMNLVDSFQNSDIQKLISSNKYRRYKIELS